MSAELTLDALEAKGRLFHHSDSGAQYMSIRYAERLEESGVEPIGNDPPAESEQAHYDGIESLAMTAGVE